MWCGEKLRIRAAGWKRSVGYLYGKTEDKGRKTGWDYIANAERR